MNEFQSPLKDPNDTATILAKDALYNAAGITAYELYDEVIIVNFINELYSCVVV